MNVFSILGIIISLFIPQGETIYTTSPDTQRFLDIPKNNVVAVLYISKEKGDLASLKIQENLTKTVHRNIRIDVIKNDFRQGGLLIEDKLVVCTDSKFLLPVSIVKRGEICTLQFRGYNFLHLPRDHVLVDEGFELIDVDASILRGLTTDDNGIIGSMGCLKPNGILTFLPFTPIVLKDTLEETTRHEILNPLMALKNKRMPKFGFRNSVLFVVIVLSIFIAFFLSFINGPVNAISAASNNFWNIATAPCDLNMDCRTNKEKVLHVFRMIAFIFVVGDLLKRSVKYVHSRKKQAGMQFMVYAVIGGDR